MILRRIMQRLRQASAMSVWRSLQQKSIPACTHLLSLSLIFISSCVVIYTPGLFSAYSRLSEENKAKVVFVAEHRDICELSGNNEVFAITASHLLDCMRHKDSSLIYFWSPHCHAETCLPIRSVQEWCKQRGFELFVIVEYYDTTIFTMPSGAVRPLFTVNHLHYKSHYCNTYLSCFIHELKGTSHLSKTEKYRRFFFFHSNRLIRTQENL